MKKVILFHLLLCLSVACSAQYNNLFIPDTLSGPNFNLTIKDTFAQIASTGNQTITAGVNGKFLGPTLFMNKGDVVHVHVLNSLNDSTTVHWHGFHLPAIMDGGPHQVIPPGAVWQPYWKVTNNAATYWYHPHMHETTMQQVISGIAGLIIVRDPVESALDLPRTYGVDDIPLILSDRKFDNSNQMVVAPYGDSALVNMTLRPQHTVPAQVVRFRVLNAAVMRGFNLGFSDNRTFYVVTSDGGLLQAPVPVSRYHLNVGERIEILVDFSGQTGSSVNLVAYNASLTSHDPGGDNYPQASNLHNALSAKDFNLLHLIIGASVGKPVTKIPDFLSNFDPIPASNSSTTRILNISESTGAPGPNGPLHYFNNRLFDLNHIDYSIPINNTETWNIRSNSNLGHPFHMHDVQFNILSVNGAPPAPAQAGWKDVVYVPHLQTVRVIAKFEDYADTLHPYMYHCHLLLHEDAGLMGQFVVSGKTTEVTEVKTFEPRFSIFPNPASDRIYVQSDDAHLKVYYVKIIDQLGRMVLMLPSPDISNGIDVHSLKNGVYHLILTDEKSKKTSSKAFSISNRD